MSLTPPCPGDPGSGPLVPTPPWWGTGSPPTTSRRWTGAVDSPGLVLEEVPVPAPGLGEVLIRVAALALDHRGQVPLAGVVDALGDGVREWTAGDRVTSLHVHGREDGVLAEHVVLPADRVARAPHGLDLAEAATLPVAGLTAWNALFEGKPVGAASKVLVIGSGGVSLSALEFARAVGSRVFAVVGDDDTGRHLERLGATGFVTSTSTPDWGAAVFDLTGGVDKVVDTVGAATLNQSITALGHGGEAVLIDPVDLGGVDGDLLPSKAGTLRTVAAGTALSHRRMVEAVERHGLHPVVHQRFRFEDAPAAVRAHLVGDLVGQVVIEVP